MASPQYQFQKHRRRPDVARDLGRKGGLGGGFSRGPALRLLPAVIIAAMCLLGFRIQVVVQNFSDSRTATVQMTPSVALAQDAPAADVDMADAGVVEGQAEESMADPSAELGSAPLSNFDPTSLTQEEIETLQRLAERREIIENRERELDAKEGLLSAAETRIDGKISQLQELEQSIEALLAQYDEKKQGEIQQLVNIYGAMKPKDAARIFDSLEMPILVSVVQTMKESKVAPILAAMDVRKATALTEELTARRSLPAMNPG